MMDMVDDDDDDGDGDGDGDGWMDGWMAKMKQRTPQGLCLLLLGDV